MTARDRRRKAERAARRYDEKMLQQAANLALEQFAVLPCYVLREQFGFGNKRMERFVTALGDLFKSVCAREVRTSTLANSVEAETGIRFINGEIWNIKE